MILGISNLQELDWGVRTALEDMEVAIQAGWGVEHKGDGTHGAIVADSIEVPTITGPTEITDRLTFSHLIVAPDAIISAAQITADKNNYDPVGTSDAASTLSEAYVVRLESDAARTITGIAAPALNPTGGNRRAAFLRLLNRGSYVISLPNLSGSSSSANQIRTPNTGTVGIQPGGSVDVWYDPSSINWRVLLPACSNAGQYTPTLTKITNLTGTPNAYSCQWSRTGDQVTVAGRFGVEPSAAASTLTELGVSLPVASNIANAGELGGTAVAITSTTVEACSIEGDATNNRAHVKFLSSTTSDHDFFFTFSYQVL